MYVGRHHRFILVLRWLYLNDVSLPNTKNIMFNGRRHRVHYYPGAAMLDEESHVVCGLMLGLNVIDCTFNIKDQDLDTPVSILWQA